MEPESKHPDDGESSPDNPWDFDFPPPTDEELAEWGEEEQAVKELLRDNGTGWG